MITHEQIIILARATLQHKDTCPIAGERITEATDAELVRFTREAIDAATVGLREESMANCDFIASLLGNHRARFEAYKCKMHGWTPERIAREIDANGDYSHPYLAQDWGVWCAALNLPNPE